MSPEGEQGQHENFDFLARLREAASNNPSLAAQLQSMALNPPLGQDLPMSKTFPSGSSSSTIDFPYPDNTQLLLQRAALENAQKQMQTQNAGHNAAQARTPTTEHPVQVPVRVVNPEAMEPVPGSGAGKSNGNLRLRLDLNLDVEITLTAKIRGDLTLALL
jgi:hypothetical protein